MSDGNVAASRQDAHVDSTTATTSTAVAAAAQQRLRASSHHALHDVQCVMTDGALILRGYVPSFYFKQLAQEVVRKVDGARVIVNELEVEDRTRSAANGQANGMRHVRSTKKTEKTGSTEATHGRHSDTECG